MAYGLCLMAYGFFFNSRQNLMEAFIAVRNLFFSDIGRIRYQAQHVKLKCGYIKES